MWALRARTWPGYRRGRVKLADGLGTAAGRADTVRVPPCGVRVGPIIRTEPGGQVRGLAEIPMKVVPTMFAEMSGSLAGTTFARARGGVIYGRARVTPTNPNTVRQQVVRANMSSLSSTWELSLTPAERASWNTLAEGTAASGIGLFTKGNAARLQASLDAVLEYDAALVEPIPTVGAATNAATAINVAYSIDDFANVDGAALLFYIQRPVPPSRTYENRERFLGAVLGDSGSPPTSPFTGVSPWGNGYAAGDTSIIRATFVDPSGRYVDAGTTELTWA